MRDANKLNVTLWVLQVLLGLFIGLASGLPKLLLPLDALPMPIPLPDLVIRLIGVAEVLGGLGLILPGITHIRPGLTPLAAAGLVVVTIGATAYQFAAGQPESSVFAIVIGLIAAFIAYGRWHLVPLRAGTRRRALQPVS